MECRRPGMLPDPVLGRRAIDPGASRGAAPIALAAWVARRELALTVPRCRIHGRQ